MTHAPMPDSLLAQMESLAASRKQEPPAKIIHWDNVESMAKQPKRPRVPYWVRDEGGE